MDELLTCARPQEVYPIQCICRNSRKHQVICSDGDWASGWLPGGGQGGRGAKGHKEVFKEMLHILIEEWF